MVARKKTKTTTRKKKTTTKKKGRVGSVGSGLKKYNSFIKRDPAVKRKDDKIKELESQLRLEKKAKAAAKKAARKKYKAKYK